MRVVNRRASATLHQALVCAVVMIPINNMGDYNLTVAENNNLVRHAAAVATAACDDFIVRFQPYTSGFNSWTITNLDQNSLWLWVS